MLGVLGVLGVPGVLGFFSGLSRLFSAYDPNFCTAKKNLEMLSRRISFKQFTDFRGQEELPGPKWPCFAGAGADLLGEHVLDEVQPLRALGAGRRAIGRGARRGGRPRVPRFRRGRSRGRGAAGRRGAAARGRRVLPPDRTEPSVRLASANKFQTYLGYVLNLIESRIIFGNMYL